MIFFGDLETYCETPLRNGGYRYAEDAEIIVGAYAIGDDPVSVIDFTREPGRLDEYVDRMLLCDEIVFHRSMFDRVMLNARGYDIPLEKIHDTFVRALMHSLPGSLDKLCAILKVDQDKAKLKVGKELIQLFCKPRPKSMKLRRATRATHPEQWKQFLAYAEHDITAMRAVYKKLPHWNDTAREWALWQLDQRINDRGIAVDLDMAKAAIETADREQQRLAARTHEMTQGEIHSAGQRDKLLGYLLMEHGVNLPDLKADTIERRLNDEELTQPVKELLEVRLQTATASVAKYKALLRSVSSDGRLHGTLNFRGAMRTGRWSAQLFQPHNLSRVPGHLKKIYDDVAQAITANGLDLVYGDQTMETLGCMVRGSIIAPKGKKLVIRDLANIEGRFLAWLAGEQWKLDAFRAADADPTNKALDLYVLGYARSFNVTPQVVVEDTLAGGIMRQIGKVQELALGYGGGVGAFVSISVVYGIDLEEMASRATVPPQLAEKAAKAWAKAGEQERTYGLSERVYTVCWSFVRLWRAANPSIESFWYTLEQAVIKAINEPGSVFYASKISAKRTGSWLTVRLPSGRFLCYPAPKLEEEKGKVSYLGVNQYSRSWQRIYSYGGKFAENVTQAGSCDVLASSMAPMEREGYPIVLTVHDEVVTETPDDPAFNQVRLGELLTTLPSWAEGLPLASAGYETHRYRKD